MSDASFRFIERWRFRREANLIVPTETIVRSATSSGFAANPRATRIDEQRATETPRPATRATEAKVVFLMRGLPSCGKSRRARELVGAMGLVCETDEFFHTQVGAQADKYDYDADRQQEARDWNYRRFTEAVDAGVCRIAVDRGNGLNLETQRYARYAVDRAYTVLLAEPDSPWWSV